MRNIIDITFAIQICLAVGGLLAALWVSPVFLLFSGAGLLLMGALYKSVKVYEQAQD